MIDQTKNTDTLILDYLNLSDSLYISLDEHACIVMANKSTCELLGVEHGSILGMNWTENFIPVSKKEETKDIFKKIFTKEIELQRTYENEIITNKGESKWIRWTSTFCEQDENAIKLVSSGIDITHEKKQSLQIQEQQQFLRVVLDENPNVIIVKDYEGRYVLGNQAVATLYNTTTLELEGKSDADFNNNVDQVNHYLQSVQEIMRSGETQVVFEESTNAKTGEIRFFQSIKKPITTPNGERQILIIANDITPIKKAQQKLKENEQILYHISKLASMGEMLENVSYQWREPLSLISTAASSLKFQNEYAQKIDESLLMSSIDSILNASSQLSQTIDDFRDFFKTDKERTDFCLRSVYFQAKDVLESKFKTQEIMFVEHIQDIELLGYKNELIQVFMNLLNNSNDALNETQVSEKRIFVDITQDEQWIYIRLKDNGGGIPNDIIAQVFDPYFSTKENRVGTGIGLYMSQEIITKHMKGFLEVQNETFEYEGQTYKGATFLIRLPKE